MAFDVVDAPLGGFRRVALAESGGRDGAASQSIQEMRGG
jgi:hypothetical protein